MKPTPTQTIAELAIATPQLSTLLGETSTLILTSTSTPTSTSITSQPDPIIHLLAAVQAADLVETLSGEGAFKKDYECSANFLLKDLSLCSLRQTRPLLRFPRTPWTLSWQTRRHSQVGDSKTSDVLTQSKRPIIICPRHNIDK